MVILAKRDVVSDVSFDKTKTVICLVCNEALYVDTALLNKDGVTAWGERQHTCEKCGVQYVAE